VEAGADPVADYPQFQRFVELKKFDLEPGTKELTWWMDL